MKYKAYFMKDPEFKIIPFIIKPKDVYRFFDYGYMDAVICFEDVLDNYSLVKNKVILPNEKAKEDFPNASDEDLNRYSLSYFNRGVTGGKKWVNSGAKGYNYKRSLETGGKIDINF